MVKTHEIRRITAILLSTLTVFWMCACGTPSVKSTVTFVYNYDGAGSTVLDVNGSVQKPQDPVRDGYVFDGWCTDMYGVNEYDFGAAPAVGNIRLFARWKQTEAKVTFRLPDGSVFATQNVKLGVAVEAPKTEPTGDGVVFDGWCVGANGVTEYDFSAPITKDITIYAKYRQTHANVTFLYYGNSYSTQKVEIGTCVERPANIPTREDYEFTDWYTNAAFSEPFDFDKPIERKLTIYAGWKLVRATVTFNGNYQGSTSASVKTDVGQKVALPTAPVREGYDFTGWFSDTACEHAFDFDSAINDNTTVYAGWKKQEYAVTFDYNYQGAPSGAFATATVAYGETIAVPEQDPTRSGYVFTGWYATAANGEQFDFDSIISADTTLYAGWQLSGGAETGIVVNFYDDNAVYKTVKLDAPGRVTRPENPVKSGYYFAGWTREKGSRTVVNFTATRFSASANLYAIWLKGYSFEAEYTKIEGKRGQGMSLNCEGVTGLIRGNHKDLRPLDNQSTAKISNGFYVGNLFYNGAFLDFDIHAEEQVQNAVLSLRLTPDIWDMILTAEEYQVIVNGKALDSADGYNGLNLVGAIKESDTVDGKSVAGEHYKRPFENYIVTLKLNLNKGDNTIRLFTSNAHDHGATFNADTPLVDCITIYSDIELSWVQDKCYPENVFQTMADVDYKVNFD